MLFIDNLKQACSDRGTTVTALLRKLNVSKGNITSWNNGGVPSAKLLSRIAGELGCSLDYLLGQKQAPATPEDDERSKKINELMNLVKDQPDEKLDAIIALLSHTNPV